MNKEDILYLINMGLTIDLIRAYCLDMGKPGYLVDLFIKALVVNSKIQGSNLLDYCSEHATNYYTNKFNIVLVFDKNNHFIKAF